MLVSWFIDFGIDYFERGLNLRRLVCLTSFAELGLKDHCCRVVEWCSGSDSVEGSLITEIAWHGFVVRLVDRVLGALGGLAEAA